MRRLRQPTTAWCCATIALGLCLSLASCRPDISGVRRPSADADPAWPPGHEPWQETAPAEREIYWTPVSYESVQAPFPQVEDARFSDNNEFCGTCHETYTRAFAYNVHRDQACEACHGASTRHSKTRGREPNAILSFRSPEVGSEVGKLLPAAQRNEICLQCHEDSAKNPQAPCGPGDQWRTSVHAAKGVACTSCHRNHYNVPLGTPPVDDVTLSPTAPGYFPPQEYAIGSSSPVQLLSYDEPSERPYFDHSPQGLQPSPRGKSGSLQAESPTACYPCHEDKRAMAASYNHPHQIGVPFDFQCTQCHNPPPRGAPRDVDHHPKQFDCTTCHDPHGAVRAETRKDLCLTCHDNAHLGRWDSSAHNAAGLACTDCHSPHSDVGPPMHVDQPQTCFRCHGEMAELERIAHPHQIGGVNGFECTTCHDPHDRIGEFATRADVCLECHDGSPTMAWHSSIHSREGVVCVDCHNPHPKTNVPRIATINHTSVKRPQRLPMSVDEPNACYKCHQKIYGLTSLPSHHPIAEGKMVCSDCHDAHGQADGHLREATVNELCYECHAEKQGPFAYEHPPASENCVHCHEAHGTVENNLLRQPTTFLCLRCHSGHSTHGQSDQCQRCHFVGQPAEMTNVGGGPLDPMIATTPTTRQALFTDCTQCHKQVHGADLPGGFECFGKQLR